MALIDIDINEIPDRDEARKVLLCTPEHYDIIDTKNVHMEDMAGTVKKELAVNQWKHLKSVYQILKNEGKLDDVLEIAGEPGREDMVFCANQTFPWVTEDDRKVVIMGKMKHASRQQEIVFFEKFFKKLGYELIKLKRSEFFEGMGDLIPHPTKRLLYGGYGHRTEEITYEEISQLLETPIIPLELIDPHFYHLDTCFMPLDTSTLFICEEAFGEHDLELLENYFPNIISVPREEARNDFSLNAHCMRDKVTGTKTAIIQKGGTTTKMELRNYGYEVIELDTSEFIKSGGSVFCLKMMVY